MSITDAGLVDWIIAEGVLASSLEALVSGLGQRLLERGFAVSRVYLSMPTVHPAVRIVGAVWRRETGASPEAIDHARGTNLFQTSPFGAMLAKNQLRRRWRLEAGEGVNDFAILETLKLAGATDYFAALTPFRNPEAPTLEGIAMSFTADRPNGFHDEEMALIERMVMPLALAAYRIALFHVAASLLDTYVGLSGGRRILRGEIQRGRGETVYAALLLADLRGFTRFADRTAADQVIGLLDAHFDAMAEPITSRGGDILKFMGDGLLAVFPIDKDRDKAAASRVAVDAAMDALTRNRDLNQAMPPDRRLELDIALHLGEIFYGNIGSANRLDFTVVGSAVNESSRMEALCGELGTPLVMRPASLPSADGLPRASAGIGCAALPRSANSTRWRRPTSAPHASVNEIPPVRRNKGCAFLISLLTAAMRLEPGRMKVLREQDDDNKPEGITRRHALECMIWAGTGVLWTVSGGIPKSLGLLGAAEAAQAAEKGFTFLQISDSHVGFDKAANPHALDTLKEAIGKVKSLPKRPSFMIHTGDITHLSTAGQFDDASQVIGSIGLDVHYVPGEHDMLDDGLGQAYLDRYGRNAKGAGWYAFDQNGVHFIGLVNVVDLKAGGLGNLGAEQLAWLADDLKGQSSSTPIVVFAHIPLWSVYPQWGWGTADSAQALATLKRFGSVTVLNGHIHQIMQKVEGNVTFHTARSTAFPQPTPGTAASPGPMTVPVDALRGYLGITDVAFTVGKTELALIDSTLAGK